MCVWMEQHLLCVLWNSAPLVLFRGLLHLVLPSPPPSRPPRLPPVLLAFLLVLILLLGFLFARLFLLVVREWAPVGFEAAPEILNDARPIRRSASMSITCEARDKILAAAPELHRIDALTFQIGNGQTFEQAIFATATTATPKAEAAAARAIDQGFAALARGQRIRLCLLQAARAHAAILPPDQSGIVLCALDVQLDLACA